MSEKVHFMFLLAQFLALISGEIRRSFVSRRRERAGIASGTTLRPAQSINDQHLAPASCHPAKGSPPRRLATCRPNISNVYLVYRARRILADRRSTGTPRHRRHFRRALNTRGKEKRKFHAVETRVAADLAASSRVSRDEIRSRVVTRGDYL